MSAKPKCCFTIILTPTCCHSKNVIGEHVDKQTDAPEPCSAAAFPDNAFNEPKVRVKDEPMGPTAIPST